MFHSKIGLLVFLFWNLLFCILCFGALPDVQKGHKVWPLYPVHMLNLVESCNIKISIFVTSYFFIFCILFFFNLNIVYFSFLYSIWWEDDKVWPHPVHMPNLAGSCDIKISLCVNSYFFISCILYFLFCILCISVQYDERMIKFWPHPVHMLNLVEILTFPYL